MTLTASQKIHKAAGPRCSYRNLFPTELSAGFFKCLRTLQVSEQNEGKDGPEGTRLWCVPPKVYWQDCLTHGTPWVENFTAPTVLPSLLPVDRSSIVFTSTLTSVRLPPPPASFHQFSACSRVLSVVAKHGALTYQNYKHTSSSS